MASGKWAWAWLVFALATIILPDFGFPQSDIATWGAIICSQIHSVALRQRAPRETH